MTDCAAARRVAPATAGPSATSTARRQFFIVLAPSRATPGTPAVPGKRRRPLAAGLAAGEVADLCRDRRRIAPGEAMQLPGSAVARGVLPFCLGRQPVTPGDRPRQHETAAAARVRGRQSVLL